MSIHEIVQILIDSGIEPNEANVEVKMLIEHFCGFSAVDIILGNKLDSSKLEIVREKALLRAKTKQPIQHILGFGYFMGQKFAVGPDVLIPRDETEFLVREAMKILLTRHVETQSKHLNTSANCENIEILRDAQNDEKNSTTVLDIGTGSGCIACTLAPYAKVTAVDISDRALKIARENAKNLGVEVDFRQSDIFSALEEGEKFDIIISNPPYIPPSVEVQREVQFDPTGALFTKDEKGLEFYGKITTGAPKFLNKGGYLLFELGIGQSEDVAQIMCMQGFEIVEIIPDLAGIERVIVGKH